MCRSAKRENNSKAALGLSLVIAILPKCPWCALAYSTAITMCTGKVYSHQVDWSSYISIFLALLTVGLVAWNYRGTRTIAAIAILAAGVVMITSAELFTGNTTLFYSGSIFIILGVWVNGSFMYFARRWTKIADKSVTTAAEQHGGS